MVAIETIAVKPLRSIMATTDSPAFGCMDGFVHSGITRAAQLVFGVPGSSPCGA